MKITMLGSGGAFTTTEYHTNYLLESNGESLLIDCGSDARFSLKEIGLDAKNIKNVYISHLHADHAGGLEWLAWKNYKGNKPNLYCSKWLETELYDYLSLMKYSNEGRMFPENFFNLCQIENLQFTIGNCQLTVISFPHIMCKNSREIKEAMVTSYGLFIEENNNKILITTDCCELPKKMEHYEKATHIFQDCETTEFVSTSHIRFYDLAKLDKSIKNKMTLVHCEPTDYCNKQDVKNGEFKGFGKKGKVYEF